MAEKKSKGSMTKIFVYLLIIPTLVFFGALFGGCTLATPNSDKLGLLEIRQGGNNETASETAVSVGYFGLCLVNPSTRLICTSIAFQSSESILASLKEQSDAVPEIAVQTGIEYSNVAVFNVLTFALIAFFLAMVLDLLRFMSRKRRHFGGAGLRTQKRRTLYSTASTVLAWVAVAAAFAAAVGTTQTFRALAKNNPGSEVLLTPNTLTLALHWVVFGLLVAISCGWTVFRRGEGEVVEKPEEKKDAT